MELSVRGAIEFDRLAADLRRMARGELQQRLRRELAREIKELGPIITAAMPVYLPNGYAAILAPATKYSISTHTTGSRVWVRFVMRSDGATELRDLPALNAGKLRHPVFGRYRRTREGIKRNKWALTRIKPGMFDDPAKQELEDVTMAALGVLDSIARELAKG